MTALPATDEAYESGTPQTTSLMGEALNHQQIASLSPFAGVVYVTHFFGLNLTHLHRPEQDDDEENLQGRFWKRHRHMDNVLTNLLLALPSHLRLPAGVRDSNVVFINFSGMASKVLDFAGANKFPSSYVNHMLASSCHLQSSALQTSAKYD